MAIANGTCVSFCNQPNEHYLATSPESRRYVVSFSRFVDADIWLRLESLRHILASIGTPLKIAVNVTWMERGFILVKAPHHVPIYLQPFPSNSTRKFKSSPF